MTRQWREEKRRYGGIREVVANDNGYAAMLLLRGNY